MIVYITQVKEIVNDDAMVVKTGDPHNKKIFFASICPPRAAQTLDEDGHVKRDALARSQPLYAYDIPYMFEAREFLRKKLIGKNVQVQVDYIQTANQGYPEKTCWTVQSAGMDI